LSVFDEAKIDSTLPRARPGALSVCAGRRRPAGQEIGTPDQLHRVMDAYGIRHAWDTPRRWLGF
jgi:hypothetical protein